MNGRSQAVDGLRDAFEFVQQECPGVCDFLVKEVLTSLCENRQQQVKQHQQQQQIQHHHQDNGNSGNCFNNHSSLHHHQQQQQIQSQQSQQQQLHQASPSNRAAVNSSQATQWRFRNSVE